MAEEEKKNKEENKADSGERKEEDKSGQKPEAKKAEIKKEEAAKDAGKKPRKEEATAYGKDAGISTKHSMAICRAIKNRTADNAVQLLEQVARMKKAIAFKGEIPHRKHAQGSGMMSGRYPVKASLYFIKLIKSLKANAENVGIDAETAKISVASANRANRPHKRGGSMKFKRTHILLKMKNADVKNKESIKKGAGKA
ncbi:50S ribosomal protein L22 [Candidatus Pacearchaeota archaeon]|nr:50S ribosomal protein L22 [Candidatus Pacearchaeota archaeon]